MKGEVSCADNMSWNLHLSVDLRPASRRMQIMKNRRQILQAEKQTLVATDSGKAMGNRERDKEK